jgi:integrase
MVTMEYIFKSGFATHITNMLNLKKAKGYKLEVFTRHMAYFDRFCQANFPNSTILTSEIVFSWCNITETKSCYRLRVMRLFGQYLSSINESTFIISNSFMPKIIHETPYIFTEDELRNFFDASDRLSATKRSPLVEFTIPVIFRLLFSCGLRPPEVRLLKRSDFNFNNNTIYISESKFRKDRCIPVNDNVMLLCQKYDMKADLIYPNRLYFFQSQFGKPYTNSFLLKYCHLCWINGGNSYDRGRPTPYDFRHNYATQMMMDLLNKKEDIIAYIPYLSSYMGHESFKYTFYYIHLITESMSQMDNSDFSYIVPEVCNDKEN